MSETVIPAPEQAARAVHDRMLAKEHKLAAGELLLRRQRRLTEVKPVIEILKAALAAAVCAAVLTYLLHGVIFQEGGAMSETISDEMRLEQIRLEMIERFEQIERKLDVVDRELAAFVEALEARMQPDVDRQG